MLRTVANQRSKHTVGCRITTVGAEGPRELHFLHQLSRVQQVANLLDSLPLDPKVSMIVRLILCRGDAQLSVLDLVGLPSAELAKHKSVARALNSVSTQLAQSSSKTSPLIEALAPTLDIYDPLNPSQVLLLCCVTPDPQDFKQSLASLKFTHRLRDCVKQTKAQSRPSWGEIDPSASPSRRTQSPERLLQTFKRPLSIETDLGVAEELMPTAKAGTTREGTTRNRSMQTGPQDLQEMHRDAHRVLIVDYKEKSSISDISPLPRRADTAKDDSKPSLTPLDRSLHSFPKTPPSDPVTAINKSVQVAGSLQSSGTQTLAVQVKEAGTQGSPHLRISASPQQVQIWGRHHSFRTLSAQTLEVEKAESASQMIPQMRDEGENTSRVGAASMGLQASLESEGTELKQELEHLFSLHVQDQEELKELRSTVQRYRQANEELVEQFTQQHQDAEDEIESLRTQLYSSRASIGRPSLSDGFADRLRRSVQDLTAVLAGAQLTQSEASLRVAQAAAKLTTALRSSESWQSLSESLSTHLETIVPALQESIKSLVEDLSKTKTELDTSRKRQFEMASLCSTLEGEVRTEQETIRALENDLAAARQQVQNSEERAKALEVEAAQAANRHTQQDALEGRVKSLQGQLAAQTLDCSLNAKRLQNAIQETEGLKTELQEMVKKYRMLESLRSQEQEEASAQFTKLAAEARRAAELSQQMLTQTQDKDSEIISLKAQLQTQTSLEALLEEKEVEVAQTRSSLNIVLREKDTAQRAVDALKAQLELALIDSEGTNGLKSRIEAIQRELAQERAKCQELVLDIDSVRKDKAQALAIKDRTEERIASELKRKEEAINSLSAQVSELRQAVKDKAIAAQDAEKRLLALQQEADRAQQASEVQGQQVADTLAKCRNLETIGNQLRSELARTSEQLVAKEEQVEALQERVAVLTDAMKESEKEAARGRTFAQQLEQRSLRSPADSDLSRPYRLSSETRDIELASLRKARDRLEVENRELSERVQRLSLTLQDLQTARKLSMESLFGQTLQQLKLHSEPMQEVRDRLREVDLQLSTFAKSHSDAHLSPRASHSREQSPTRESNLVANAYKKKVAPLLKAVLAKLQSLLGVAEAWQSSVGEKLETLKSSTSARLASSTDVFRLLQQSMPPAPDYGELSYRGSVRAADHQLCELQSMEQKTLISSLKEERDELQRQVSTLRAALATKDAEYEKCCRGLSQKDLEMHKLRKSVRSYEDIVGELRTSLQRAAAETQAAIEEKLQAMAELQSLQRRYEDECRLESPRVSHDPGKKAGSSLSDYLKQKDVYDSGSQLDAMDRRPKDSEGSNSDLRHFQRFKELWRTSPFNAAQ